MCIALSWQEGIVSDEDVTRIAENLNVTNCCISAIPQPMKMEMPF